MHTFGRLLGFLRPYKRGVIWSLVLAALAMVCTVAIPWLTGRAVDQISDGDSEGLKMLALAVVGVAVLRLLLSVFRRLVAGRVSLAIEYDLRTRAKTVVLRLNEEVLKRKLVGIRWNFAAFLSPDEKTLSLLPNLRSNEVYLAAIRLR